MPPEPIPPEELLERLYQTGREWMRARARQRAHGPPSDWGRGDNPPAWEEPRLANRDAQDEESLRQRFRELVDEFVQRIDEQ